MLMVFFAFLEMKRMQKIVFNVLTVPIKISNLLLKKKALNFCHFLTFLSKIKETVFQHQVIERKHQLGCLHSYIVLYQ